MACYRSKVNLYEIENSENDLVLSKDLVSGMLYRSSKWKSRLAWEAFCLIGV